MLKDLISCKKLASELGVSLCYVSALRHAMGAAMCEERRMDAKNRRAVGPPRINPLRTRRASRPEPARVTSERVPPGSVQRVGHRSRRSRIRELPDTRLDLLRELPSTRIPLRPASYSS